MASSTMAPQRNEPIAIVGSGCRFPGGASSPSKLWELLREPRDVLCEIPPSRFDVNGFHHTDSQFPGRTNVKHSYLLQEDVAKFDAQFFNITASEAVAMDPQQRLLLETVYEGLEGAGLTIEGLKGSNTGVYVGVMYVDYESLQFRDLQHVPTYLAIGTARSIVSNRISYFFDWHGPSLTVDTACSSSLVAVHQAVQALRSGEVRVALAAGSNLLLGPEPYIHESKLKMLSPDGRSRMWDQGANGYARGDGVAAVVLKTLSAALADGDHIEAIIRETGVNQDGRSRGITMPSAAAQASLIRATYAKAGLDPESKTDRCQYFEAHGTGTPAGDPVEAEAVHTAFFGNGNLDADRLLVGSVKTIIGHTESTAGLAGILKVVQAMQHGFVPPNMLLENLNPNVLPFYRHLQIPQELTPWPQPPPGQSRRASVNSFGFGGTNAHIILESFEPSDSPRDGEAQAVAPFLFSAQSKQSLLSSLAVHAQYLERHPDTSPTDLAWTLRSRRSRLPLRLALPASTIEVLQTNLKGIIGNSNFQLDSKAAGTSTKEARLLGVFTGQGAQWARMGAEIIETSKYAADLLATMDDALAQLPEADRPSWTLKEQLLADAKSSQVGSAFVAQPLCTAVQIILVELLRQCGVNFAAVVGHSSGEIGAAFAAGALSSVDAIRIAYYRGLHSRLAGGNDGIQGAMLAVGTTLEDAESICNDEYFSGRVKVAACNSASSITISGDEDAIVEMIDIFEDESKFVRRLRVDKAYHSHHMIPCSQPYLESMKPFSIQMKQSESNCVWISSVRPDQSLDESNNLDASYWVDNLLSPVLFMQAVEKAMELGPFDAAIEVGPHPALKGPVMDTLRDQKVDIPYTGLLQRNTNAIQSVSSAIGYVWTHVDNLIIDFDRYESALGGPKLHRFISDLPTYQWNHIQGYWHESNLSRNLRTRSQPVHQLLGDLQPQSSAHQVTWKAILRPHDLPWVHHHRIQGQTVFPAAAYAATAFETIPFLADETPIQLIEIKDLVIHQALVFGNDEQESGIEVRSVVSNISRENPDIITAHFTYEACIGSQQDFQLVASCQIFVFIGEASPETLPATACIEPYMVDVDTELAYSSLNDVGYGYTGPFKALSGLKRKLGKASGSLALTTPEPSEDVLIIHPAVLDAAFHSIILTFSYPKDGRLWSLHLPTRIDRIRVNPSLCGRHWLGAAQVPFVASMSDEAESRDTSGFQGDVDIHAYNGEHTAVQVEGLHVVPFTPASSADDQQQFYATHWVHSEPNADIPGTYEASVQDKEMATILERGSYFYLRQLEHQVPEDHLGRSDIYNAAYLSFASHTHNLVQQGKHRYAKKEWLNDTLEDILALSEPFSDQPEIKAMHIVGEQMPRAILGETTMLEHLMNNGLLADYYAQARSITRGTNLLAETVVQILQRYPESKILEVGAGTGQATREILKRVDDNFSTYTFTDVSAAFFDKAEAEFEQFEDRMLYNVLDLEQDMKTQGFEEHSYDIVVASFVLHATKSIEQTVRRVRSLLKPGGYLVLYEVTNTDIIRGTALFGCLPGWWQGIDEGRTLGACVSESKWDAVLRKTGFSGVDTMTPVKDALSLPNSVMVSQAVDDWVEFIREPLLASPSLFVGQSVIQHLFIIGGTTLRVSRLVQDIRKLIHAFCEDITAVESLERLEDFEIDEKATVLVLEDLDHPVFKDITAARWDGLKNLFGSEKSIAWVTQDRMIDNPFGNMGVGFARSALWEIPEIRYQFIDFQDAHRIDARALVEAVLRFQMSGSVQEQSQRKSLWSVESEIVIDSDGRQLVPRIRPVGTANDRYNSARRTIIKDAQTRSSHITIENVNDQYAVVERSPLISSCGDSSAVTLNLTHSSLQAIKTDLGDAFLVLGSCATNGTQYLGLWDSVASVVNIPQSSLVSCSVPLESAPLFLTAVATHLLMPALTGSLVEGDTLLVHNAPGSVTALLRSRLNSAGIKLLCTTSSKQAADQTNLIYVGRYMRQSEMRALLPANISQCVDFTTRDGSPSVASCLPASVPVVNISSLLPGTAKITRTPGNDVNSILSSTIAEAHSALANCLQDHPTVSQVNLQDVRRSNEAADALTVVDWDASSVSITVQPATAHFKSDRTYWLVGLSGDLGISIADWMIRNGAKYLVITSRNPKVDETWLRTTESRGAVVRIIACDLTDYDALSQAHREISGTLPPIAGVYQGAMILLDMALRDMGVEDFSRVLRPKVDGSLNLDRVLGDEPLDFFIFFSSVATVAGNPGQAGYTTANLFMSGMAQQRRKRGLPASVVELGLIMGTGYITREKGDVLTRPSFERGLLTISEYDVHQTLAEAIQYGHPESGAEWQISIGLRRMPANAPNRPQWYNYPQFACLTERAAVEDTSAANTQAGPTIKDRLASATTKDDVEEIITESFIAEMRKMLHLSDDYAITPAVRTDELGLDSLVAVRIRSWFLNNFQVNIPALRILKGEALQGLIDYAVEEIPEELAPKLFSLQSEDDSSSSEDSSQKSGTPPSTAPETETSSIVNGDLGLKEEKELGPREVQMERFGRLSYTQSVFLFVHELLPDKTTLNNTVMLHLSGEVRIPELSRAVRALGERHESLRSCICEHDGQPSQGVMKTPSFGLEHKRIYTKDELFNEYAALRGHVFDLSRGQTSRTILLSYSPRDHYLLMSSHHIFFDRASNDAVMGDLERLYNGVPLEPSPLQYLDYSDDQQRQYSSGQWDEAIGFWSREFTTIPDVLSLHRSQISERRPLERYASRIPDFRIDKQLSAKIRQVARKYRATPFHFHLAAFKVLLHRFLGTTDVCIGIADSCRRDDHMRTGIGPFLNMLPLRMAASAEQPFLGALDEAREKSFAVLANSIPLEVILNELRVSRQATHTPLAQAFMNYAENDLEDGQTFLGCRMKMMKQEMAELPYDITFTVINNTTGDTRILLNLQESLYTDSDAQILQHGYEDILREFANAPDQTVGNKWHFRPAVLQKALALGRGTDFNSTWPETLVHRFEGFFPSVAEKVAVTDSAGASMTYAQLSSRMSTIASELLRQGVQPGSKVAVFQHPSVCWIPSLLAILRIGAVYVPLDVNTPVARLSSIVRDCQPASILVHEFTIGEAEKLDTEPNQIFINVSGLKDTSEEAIPNLARPDAPAIILYTSGSTGTPKGVILRHSSLKHEFDHCAATYGMNEHDVVLQQSAWSFDLSVTQIFLALGVGAQLHTVSHTMRADSHAMAELIQRQGVTATYATPTEYKSWLRRESQDGLRSSAWRLALVAGEPVTEPLLQLFREVDRDGLRLFNVYGPTETTCGSTKTELSYRIPGFYQGTIPVGVASANEWFYILDASQNLQPVGQTGEIAIGGVGVAMGYLNMPDRTQASFLPDPFATEEDSRCGWATMYRTGDVGFLQHDGSLVLKGRIGDDTEIKLNGVRIDLKDVENTVLQASGGALADAVASLRSTSEGAVKFMVVHVVFSTENLAEDRSKSLQRLLAELPLPRNMCPSALIPIDALPRTVAGKVDRRGISSLPIPRGLFHKAEHETEDIAGSAALSKTERTLRRFWETVIPDELVGLHRIEASSDFFTIGGNSLLLIELQGRIRADLGVFVALPQLFQATTLRSMARLLPGIKDTDPESDTRVDWASETALLSGLAAPQLIANPAAAPPRTVVLTGATGFLGRYLARSLVNEEHVEKVICIAVRNSTDQARQDLLSQLGPKAELFEGDLSLPRLGLTEDAALRIFQAADAVIHNGADVSHLKTYTSLRAANLGATQELVRLCSPRHTPLHYISTTGVAMYTPFEALAEISVREHTPPVDGRHGYVASKWASEVYLENAHAECGLPVYIHRPSSILRPEADRTGENPAADVLQNMLDYSRRVRAVPAAPGLSGFVDLVQPETVTDRVATAVMSGARKGGVDYVHESGDLEVDVRLIREYLKSETGEDIEALALDDWIDRAEEIGLSPAMAAVFRSSLGSGEPMNLPRLLRR
ncbi:beta-ketoacyl synthase domain-containing protein [Colletotrichum graminicola M1.001]|uniref:Beta-ketoacyl synthase domain-containing protein n=1 Tax=Colletotrichum graminicola (strain M1.001 / M2 / FGSC 10212) TaxID=645133 RepID=E3QN52_COLGM|nr:beta-ketoacyl synthase domain-containing protein [Colletotrichum graminicola M1.001]EFQ32290.1 beta-ketoacyl synthase domain-containing protein [Colletotrichum graminicola M1.001]